MQTLYPKNKKGQGPIAVNVIRVFGDNGKGSIYLHHNGVYGYIDGAPVQSEKEFDIIPANHKRLAMVWWKNKGQKMSEEYYANLAATEEAQAGDFQEALAEEENNSILDSVLYTRKPKGGGAVTNPQSWMECGFKVRPDWWGQAKQIKFADFTYTMQEPADQSGNDKDNKKDDKTE